MKPSFQFLVLLFSFLSLDLQAQLYPYGYIDGGTSTFFVAHGSNTYVTYNTLTFDQFVVRKNGNAYCPYDYIYDETGLGPGGTAYHSMGGVSYISDTTKPPPGTGFYDVIMPERPFSSNAGGTGRNNNGGIATLYVHNWFRSPFKGERFFYNLPIVSVNYSGPGASYNSTFTLCSYDTNYPNGGIVSLTVALDDSLNLIATGQARHSGVSLIGQKTLNQGDFFVASIDTAKHLRWCKFYAVAMPFDGSNQIKIRCDRNGYIYFLKYLNGAAQLVKLRGSDGTEIWNKTMPTYVQDFEIDKTGQYIYFIGDFGSGMLPIYSGSTGNRKFSYSSLFVKSFVNFGSVTLTPATAWSYNYVAKTDSSGQWCWAKSYPSYPRSIKFRPGTNDLYIGGNYRDSAYFTSGAKYNASGGRFMMRIDTSGNESWTHFDTMYTYYAIENIDIDTMGNVYALMQSGLPGNSYSVNCSKPKRSIVIAKFGLVPLVYQKPTLPASKFQVVDLDTVSMKLSWVRGNGSYCVVIARKDSALTLVPKDSVSYVANAKFGLGSNLGNNTYLVYSGTGTSLTVTGLAKNTRYYYAVLEFNGCDRRERYQNPPHALVSDSTRGYIIYYSKATGYLNQLSTWGINPDGSGLGPINFNISNTIYWVANNINPQMGGDILLAGNNVQMLVGMDSLPVHLTIPNGVKLRAGAAVRLQKISALTVYGELTIGDSLWGDSLSSIILMTPKYGAPTGYSYSPPPSFKIKAFNLALLGKNTYDLGNDITVKNQLNLDAHVIANVTLGKGAKNGGVFLYTAGTISNFSRWITGSPSSAYVFPIGTFKFSSTSGYSFIERRVSIDYTTPPVRGGMVNVQYKTVGAATGLPLIDSGGSALTTVNKLTNGTNGWYLDTLNGLRGGICTLTFTDTISNTSTPLSAYRVLKQEKSSSTFVFKGTAGINTGTNSRPVVGRLGISDSELEGAYQVGFDSTAIILPVSWLLFEAHVTSNDVLLNWCTATETNNSHFEVERSTDARNFEHIGEVSGAGNSAAPLTYTFTDVAPFGTQPILYYRLKQVDFNGAFDYSSIIAVSKDKTTNGIIVENIYPNPFNRDVKITLNNVSEGNMTIAVCDISGKVIYTQVKTTDGGNQVLDLSELSNLPEGVYLLSISNGNETIRQKLVKVK